ncbi:MAG TPA: hypothetical protein VFM53_02125 [Anaeromyxobacteraceae bacterium]|nr:hypothetical protein [Anaeromyxobacteraceae bacterium]
MSTQAHFAVFWMAGLLTGTLLGWMLGRNQLARAEQRPGEPPADGGERTRS